MFSGKTETLIHRLKRAALANHPLLTFKPSFDNRWNAPEEIRTHSRESFPATPVPADNPESILGLLKDGIAVIGIDEVQFFSPGIVGVCDKLVKDGFRVIVSGLDMDYAGCPFGSVPELMATAEKVDKLTAVCTICGEPATRTQRLVVSTNLIDIGADDKYTARCRKHWNIPEEPDVRRKETS
jgi:thymidine kinase